MALERDLEPGPPDGRQFEVAIHVPEPLLLEISASAAAGLVERMVFDIRLERAFLPDRERPNGFEDEPAFLPPIDKNGRQPGPNLGYISVLWVRERRVSLKKDGEDDGGEFDEDLPAPIPVQANVLAVSPPVGDGSALKMIASRLDY
ncbi:hypothetical protein HN018_26015 (plasmid) [Lichenicola cladoniae]|uniref:Uncharacterized protein n=1 Tax=Lichenicola cladoniae TaxID=1484109 RepID=A0A6M8HZ44_9PROT|nr:hypothetical protein [Lichenicola cladoniae]NPD70075.1 hypothetical protein [Acetobacteraceae bacterium]QKE93620.1 hypothetical protein HN018_26015 [Lichenicola cladoniae]